MADPAVSTAWGIAVLGEQVRGGLFLALTLIPLAIVAGSVFLLSRSPVLQTTPGESPGEASEDSQGARALTFAAQRPLAELSRQS